MFPNITAIFWDFERSPALLKQMAMDFFLVHDSAQAECYPLTVLRRLAQAGKLGRFTCRCSSRKASSKQRAKALADDVADAFPTPLNWRWYTGVRPGGAPFSWIE